MTKPSTSKILRISITFPKKYFNSFFEYLVEIGLPGTELKNLVAHTLTDKRQLHE